MSTVDRLKEMLGSFSAKTPNPDELTRLQEFLEKMRKAGVVKVPEYNLPLPDTIGRAVVEQHSLSGYDAASSQKPLDLPAARR